MSNNLDNLKVRIVKLRNGLQSIALMINNMSEDLASAERLILALENELNRIKSELNQIKEKIEEKTTDQK